MKRAIPLTLLAGSFLFFIASCTKDRILEQNIITETPNNTGEVISINEFLAMGSTLTSDVGVECDWIELYNKSNTAFTLKAGEWFISDTPTDLEKFELPQKTIAAGGFLMLFCDDDGINVIPANSPLIHLSFGLSSTAGESVVLSRKVDGVTSIVDQKDFLAQTDANMSNARIPNGIGNWSYPVSPTPGASNQ